MEIIEKKGRLKELAKLFLKLKLVSVFLDAVNVASVAIIVAVCYQMGRDTITDWRTVAISVMSLAFVFGFRKVNSAIIVLGGSLLGYWLSFF